MLEDDGGKSSNPLNCRKAALGGGSNAPLSTAGRTACRPITAHSSLVSWLVSEVRWYAMTYGV